MLTDGINFKNFNVKAKPQLVKKKFELLIKENNEVLKSLSKNYQNSFSKNFVSKYKKFSNFRIIGLGGSTLGSQAIYQFLFKKIKKKFVFIDNLDPSFRKSTKTKNLNLIISKSGNTIETIANANILINKKDKNIFLTENRKSHLYLLAKKLKSEIVHHNNFIGGRYSVLSEVGMLPAELMNLNSSKFKQFNNLIKNKSFLKNLIANVAATISLIQNKKYNSVIINYDNKSENLFQWYQQLVAESLGKNKKGILPIISNMPKDNHSVMQLYLDGFQNNFFTFFYVHEKRSEKLKNKLLFTNKYLKNKNFSDITYAQKKASEKVFLRKNIPFRSFEIRERNEKTLGELFSFFILETILLGKCLKLNPYNQPSVELIKKETKKLLI